MKLKLTTTLLLVVLSVYFLQAQENKKLKFKSMSTGFGISSGELNSGGTDAYIDVSANLGQTLFSIAITAGSEFNLFDAKRNFNEYALLIGRELNVSKIVKIEILSGIALFKETYKNDETNFETHHQSAVGIPFKLKLLFYTSKRFALGINPNFTINSIENTITGNLVFQYNFYKIGE